MSADNELNASTPAAHVPAGGGHGWMGSAFSPVARFIGASGLTNLGDGIALVAWAWTASLITRDPLLIALVAVLLRLPWAIVSLPAGVITDRVDRRNLILGMDVLRAVAFLGVAIMLWFAYPFEAAPERGVSSIVAYFTLLLAAAIVGTAEVFRDNAAQTMIPGLVPDHRLEATNGRLWSVELVGNSLLGPALGAMLVAIALPLPFALNAVAYGVAALLVLSISGSFRANGHHRADWRQEMKEGIAFLRTSPLLKTLAWLTGFWNLFFQMVMIALVLHVQENLGLSAQAYGLILAAGAVGGIIGGLVAEHVVRAIGQARAAQWMLFSSVPTFAVIAVAPGQVSLGLTLAVFEFCGLVWNTISVSTRQRTIPDHLLGRVNSTFRLLAWGMMPIGLLLSGIIVRMLDGPLTRGAALTAPFWVAAAGVLIVSLFGWRPLGLGLRGRS
jgi:hypothetical protein